METGTIHNALAELKNVMNTPIKPYQGRPAASPAPAANGGGVDADPPTGSLSPSPSLLLTRGDDTSGCSSLDGSTDSLVAVTSAPPPALHPQNHKPLSQVGPDNNNRSE